MGYHYTERLFKLVRNTDSTQQLVLAVLAHRTDDRTGQCYLSIDEIAERARLHRATVIKVLDDLRPRLLTWVKRVGKDRRLSNLYTLKLPDFPKANDVTPVVNDDQSPPVAQNYPTRRPRRPHPSPTTTPPVAQNDPTRRPRRPHPSPRTTLL